MSGTNKVKMSRRYLALVAALNNRLDHFPSHEQRALAQVIREKLYSLCDHMVEAQKRYHKNTHLNNLDIAHEQLRMHLFTASQQLYFAHPLPKGLPEHLSKSELEGVMAKANQERYEKLTVLVDEFGRLIGGWQKKLAKDAAQKEVEKKLKVQNSNS